jgi:hypothetical protein
MRNAKAIAEALAAHKGGIARFVRRLDRDHVPSSQSVPRGLGIQDALNDGIGKGFHPFVARVPGDPVVRE